MKDADIYDDQDDLPWGVSPEEALRSRRKSVFVMMSLIFALLLILFSNRIFINVYSGQAGVVWYRFFGGTDLKNIHGEGLHVIFPWDKMHVYNTRVQQRKIDFQALSKDGLEIGFLVSVRYAPHKKWLPRLHQMIGPDYANKVVIPEVQAHVRRVVAAYGPEEIYTSEGYLLQIMTQGATAALYEQDVILEDLLIQKITLPVPVVEAIQRKVTQKQIALEYEYRLQTATKEAERKKIEAQGIRRFQETVNTGDFFDKYLRYRGVDATLELAQSDNAKVVVVGGGSSGLPLILDTATTTPQTAATDGPKARAPIKPPSDKATRSPPGKIP